MHGTIFSFLKRYVQTQYDHAWVHLVQLSGLQEVDSDHKMGCPDEHLYALVGHAAAATGLPAAELPEKFGEYLVPNLMYTYQKLIKPEWKTLHMLEHTEGTMHRQVRQEHAENSPPVLHVERLGPERS